MIDGILIIDKKEGITSYDVIRRLKRFLPKGQKIGHAGTLDPFASGVLIILLGRATKQMERILKLHKVYRVIAKFGFATDTQDITGEVIKRSDKQMIVDLEEIISKNFLGEISQIPPRYSAKKIDGKRAYELARKNVDFEIKPKLINIYRFETISIEEDEAEFEIECSSGTYIRTLINDLGNITGSYATAKALRRISIGEYNIKESVKFDDINEDILNYIIEDYE